MIKLPKISTKRLAVKLKPTAEKHIRQRHPWVFEGSITKVNPEGNAGDLAIIYDSSKNKFLACGLYDPTSPIRIKLLQFLQPATIDENWFRQKIAAAYEMRRPLLATNTNSYRLIFGENDGLPGLIGDVYAGVMVVKLYSAIWYPYLKMILPALIEKSAAKTLVLRLSRQLQTSANEYGLTDGQILYGELENETIIFNEHGIRFSANVIKGHKTGYFLDHRHNRKKVGEMAKGKTVLDVFCYTGGFSTHALAGDAKSILSLDISGPALEVAKQNAALNPHKGKHKTMQADAFEGLRQLKKEKRQFDIVVIDPPSFAKSEKEVPKAKEQYARLAKLGAGLVSKHGLLVLASCSSRVRSEEFFTLNEENLAGTGKRFKLEEKTGHDIDHPVGFPEGAYLKCGYYRHG